MERDDRDIPPGSLDAFRRGRIMDDRRSGEDRREDEGARRKTKDWALIAAIILAVLGWVYGAAGAGVGDYSRVRDRLTTLESQRASDSERMGRIESKLDRLLERQR